MLPIDGQTVRLIRLFRLLRLIKLIGTLEQLELLYTMTTAMRGMTWVLMWATFLLLLILSIVSLLLTQGLHATYFASVGVHSPSDEDAEKTLRLFENFGSFLRCMFSLFQMALGSFSPLARLLAEDLSETFFIVCVAYKLVIGFAVVEVMNSIVLQETLNVASTDDCSMARQKKQKRDVFEKKLRAFFVALDADGRGVLSLADFMQLDELPEVTYWLQAVGLQTDELGTFFRFCDDDNDGLIGEEEFVECACRLNEPVRPLDIVKLRESLKRMSHIREDDASRGSPSDVEVIQDLGKVQL
eukprot:TRINITY_DN12316_c0_g1_i4.p1 TRINITY_DN12316_c0_g1~~TRINITY_DN12316_c0_g1_i4.p1  ORF type:complete len:300 (+),score=49.57 TRINITY_DN12316_c0_g1_i4:312-1211(+)